LPSKKHNPGDPVGNRREGYNRPAELEQITDTDIDGSFILLHGFVSPNLIERDGVGESFPATF